MIHQLHEGRQSVGHDHIAPERHKENTAFSRVSSGVICDVCSKQEEVGIKSENKTPSAGTFFIESARQDEQLREGEPLNPSAGG